MWIYETCARATSVTTTHINDPAPNTHLNVQIENVQNGGELDVLVVQSVKANEVRGNRWGGKKGATVVVVVKVIRRSRTWINATVHRATPAERLREGHSMSYLGSSESRIIPPRSAVFPLLATVFLLVSKTACTDYGMEDR